MSAPGQGPGDAAKLVHLEGLIERSHWLIGLRWAAFAGVLSAIFLANHVLRFSLDFFPLYATGAAVGLYNLAFFLLLRFLRGKETIPVISAVANAQISLDLLSLAILIHLSGGIENPFLFYFIFHMIIASILLDRKASFGQATLAAGLFCIVVVGEYFNILPHRCLQGFTAADEVHNALYIAGVSFVFISTLYIAVYMATSISSRLRLREKKLEEVNAQLEEKDRIKSEYVLRVTHGIKEHLSAIQSCLDPVAGGIVGELNPRQFDLVHRAVLRTAKLTAFVKALLRITRIKLSRQLKMEHFFLKDVVMEAVNTMLAKAKDKNIALTCTVEPTVEKIRATREYVQETLVNLLANSVKYTPANGTIDVRVKDRGGTVLIEIADTGIGIPPEELPRIFEEFYRASNAKEIERDGTGLGLSIAKQVVELHHGRIWVESEQGRGSAFFVELPK